MSEVWDWPFRKVIEISASNSPTPGGGSVSALVASLGVAMVAMVGNLTVGKEKYKDVEADVKEVLDQVYALIEKLERLVDQDIAEFSRFMQVLKMPKETAEQKETREKARQEALKSATDTPLEIAVACLEGVRLADRLASIGNKGAISDVGVAAYIGEAALNAALLSVDINLPSITDAQYVDTATSIKLRLIGEARSLKERAITVVQDRLK